MSLELKSQHNANIFVQFAHKILIHFEALPGGSAFLFYQRRLISENRIILADLPRHYNPIGGAVDLFHCAEKADGFSKDADILQLLPGIDHGGVGGVGGD